MSEDVIAAHYSQVEITASQLNHEAWTEVEPVSITHYWSGEPAPSARHAKAKLIWTSNGLLARFECRQEEPLIVASTPQTTQKTLGLWDRDVSEIFIAPDIRQQNRYFEFEASPAGEWVDLAIALTADRRITDWDFQSGVTVAARIEESKVVTAMHIPWSNSVPKPQHGDEWLVNLCRCVGSGPDRGYLAWQPTYTEVPNFHVPSAFGRLKFM